MNERTVKLKQRGRSKPKVKSKRCAGIVRHKHDEQCHKNIGENESYCKYHNYFKYLTGAQINDIKEGKAKCCGRCGSWHFGKRDDCDSCSEQRSLYHKNQKKKAIRCKGFRKNDDQPCQNRPIDETKYCKDHQYMVGYTDYQLANLKKCTGCNRKIYFEEGKTCDDCKERGKDNREKHRNNKIICKGNVKGKPCTFEARKNGYCGNHQVQAWKDDIEKDGSKKVCTDYIRGCKNILDKIINGKPNKHKRCNNCRYKYHYKHYQYGAKKRNLDFEIEKEFFYEFIKNKCEYCGMIDHCGWNGIDRSDNKKGYTINNIVPCCSMCNKMKSKYTINKFIKFCKNISNNYPTIELHNTNKKTTEYEKYKKSHNRQRPHINFNLQKEFYDNQLLYKCIYCGDKNLNSQIGLDRIDSSNNYDSRNVFPCCKICNTMKNNYDLTTFILKIQKIEKYNIYKELTIYK